MGKGSIRSIVEDSEHDKEERRGGEGRKGGEERRGGEEDNKNGRGDVRRING